MTNKRNRETIAAHSKGAKLLMNVKAKKRNHEGKVWTYLDIANAAGTSDKTVSKFFKRKAITPDYAMAIAKALDLNIEDIVDRDDYERLTAAKSKSPDLEKFTIPWQERCKSMLELKQKRAATSNFLLHDDEDSKFDRKQIYVPLALVERRKRDKKEREHSPEEGSKLYEPQYEEKQRFEHQAFLQQILEKGESKTKGKRIALIGEPGAGKTTTLQDIAFWVLEKELGLPIWVSLADLVKNENENLIDFETYLFETWLKLAVSLNSRDTAKRELSTQIEQGRVWLLLDGVDEVTASGVQILQYLSQQLQGWLGKSQIVLTCRLNVWQADLNFLSNFETYRLLNFDYPQQVHQFINNWFSNKDASQGERLKTELDNPDKARVRDLIQNPLRLTLLCDIWEGNKAKLPDTKAELYTQFVVQFYRWKSNRFPIENTQRKKLNQALGRLAKKDIDSSNSRFRLQESFISQELNSDKENYFDLALRLGWLNNVGIAAESSTREKVYAFFHSTFQEYFAACAIDDWDFFLPSNHKNKPVKGKEYRIFQPQWQEVILLWLGRKDIDEAHKKSFINKLINFKDGCSPGKGRVIDRGFYEYQAYFLAAKGVAEFESTQTKTIVKQIIDYVLFDCLVWSDAKDALMATNRKEATAILTEYLQKYRSDDEYFTCKIAQVLGEVDPGNRLVSKTLSEIVLKSTSEYIRREAINIFGRITIYNEATIKILLDIIRKSSDEYIYERAVSILKDIGKNKRLFIKILTLVKANLTKHFTDDKKLWRLYHDLLVLADTSYDDDLITTSLKSKPKIDYLINTIKNGHPENSDYQLAIINLGDVDEKDREIAIANLTHLCKDSSDEHIVMSAVESLYRNDSQNKLILETVPRLIENASHPNIISDSIACLDKFDKVNDETIEALATVIETSGDEEIIRRAAEALGVIDPGNRIATDKLIDLINLNHDKYKKDIKSIKQIKNRKDYLEAKSDMLQMYQYRIFLVVEILCEIAPENKIAHDHLVYLIKNYYDDYHIRERAMNALIAVMNQSLTKKSIVEFKQYLLPIKYENSLRIRKDREQKSLIDRPLFNSLYDKCRKFCWHFEEYYDLFWFCSKQISYKEFYQAWHQQNLFISLKRVWHKILFQLGIYKL